MSVENMCNRIYYIDYDYGAELQSLPTPQHPSTNIITVYWKVVVHFVESQLGR